MDRVTQEILLKHFNYLNGGLYYTLPIAKRTKVGDRFGWIRSDGYRQGSINSKSYFEHRLIWLYHYGEWPKDQLDHINGNRSDNRVENLREATQNENQRNKRGSASGTSQYKGVCWNKPSKKWRAQYRLNGVTYYLGSFDCEVEAAKAYDNAVRNLHGKFRRLNFG